MVKIGIICDDYKVEMFEQELKRSGVIYTIDGPLSNSIKELIVITCMSERHIIGSINEKVTRYFDNHFKQMKNN